jgi:hypothetical protein
MANSVLAFGDEVLIPWGFADDVRGIVQEVYGPRARRHVIVLLTPQLSDSVVDEPSTVSMPIDLVKKVVATA